MPPCDGQRNALRSRCTLRPMEPTSAPLPWAGTTHELGGHEINRTQKTKSSWWRLNRLSQPPPNKARREAPPATEKIGNRSRTKSPPVCFISLFHLHHIGCRYPSLKAVTGPGKPRSILFIVRKLRQQRLYRLGNSVYKALQTFGLFHCKSHRYKSSCRDTCKIYGLRVWRGDRHQVLSCSLHVL